LSEADRALLKAARQRNIEAVKQHLAAGADVNAKVKDGLFKGSHPLYLAADRGHKETVELLIAEGANVNAKTDFGNTALHGAAFEGRNETAELLIAAGADVNANNVGGVTPLHWAAQEGQKEIAELLIAKGADVNAKSDEGETPIDWGYKKNHLQRLPRLGETADLLRKHGGKTKKELEVAARPSRQQRSESSNNSDKEKALELLLGTNSTITEKDEAFLSAAKKGELDKVKSLLVEGVDIDCSDAFSCTGLFWASANNHKSIVEFLIEKGANLNAGAGWGGTPLARAAYEGHVEVVELLIAKGADVNAKDVSGGSPLDSADESVVDLLRKHGAK